MPRFFTLWQAERLLPEVEGAIREAIEAKQAYQTAHSALEEGFRKLAMLGGVRVDPNRFLQDKAARDNAANRLQQRIGQIQDLGCLVKDLDIGLLDFPTLFRGQEVYLCWKLGEEGIHFWHGVEEGFRGRKAIDQEFLDQHSTGA